MNKRMMSVESLRILFCGSFKFLDEMKRIAAKLETQDFKCLLPRFALGNLPAKEIERIKANRKKNGLRDGEFEKVVEVTSWFYKQLKEADVLIIFNKNGYAGLSLAAEIGAAHFLGKPTLFLEEPEDAGIKALLRFSPNFKIVSLKNLTKEVMSLSKQLTR